MMMEYMTDKYIVWRNGDHFTVTTRKRREVFSGTLAECQEFMAKHPYGMTGRQQA